MSLLKTNLSCKWCSSSDAMCEYDNGWHCFSCNNTEFKSEKDIQTSDIKPDILEEKVVELPIDYTNNVPLQYRHWWRQYNIRDEDTEYANFGWSEKYKRIIVPIYQQDLLLKGWVGRAVFPWQNNKYITKGKQLIFKPKGFYDFRSPIVVTEDILSAVRVSEHHPTWAALGTGCNYLIEEIKKGGWSKVIIWLDGDKAGRDGARKLFKRLNQFIPCDIITTDKDPKEYNYETIREILKIE